MHYGKRKFSQRPNIGRRYANGGAVNPDEPKVVRTIFEEEEYEYEDGGEIIDDRFTLIEEMGDYKIYYNKFAKNYAITWRKRFAPAFESIDEAKQYIKDRKMEYADGGMMARGGVLKFKKGNDLVVLRGMRDEDNVFGTYTIRLEEGRRGDVKGIFKVYTDPEHAKYLAKTYLNGTDADRIKMEDEFKTLADGGMMKRGGKLKDKANYIPNRMIQAVEVERKGKTTEIDGADIFDGIYVKKRVKYGHGGTMHDSGQHGMSKTAIFEVIDYDVWGNEEDGFEVNNKFRTGEEVMLLETMTDNEITKSLIRQGALKQEADGNVDYDGEFEYTLYLTDSRNSEPIMELQFLRYER